MSSIGAYTEIKDWLQTNWGATYTILDFEEVNDDILSEDNAFIAIEEDEAREDVIAVCGIRPSVEEVVPFILHVFFPGTVGLIPVRQLAEEFAIKGRQLELSDDRTGAGRINRVHPPNPGILNDGLWSSMTIEMEYGRHHRPNLERQVTS